MVRGITSISGVSWICFSLVVMLLETAGDSKESQEVARVGLVTSIAASYEAWDDVSSVAWAMYQPSDLRKARGLQRHVHVFCAEYTLVSDTSSASLSPFQWSTRGTDRQLFGSTETQDVGDSDDIKHSLGLRRIQIAEHGTSFRSWAEDMWLIAFIGVLPLRELCSNIRPKCVYVPPQLQSGSLLSSDTLKAATDTILAWEAGGGMEVWARGPDEEARLLRKRKSGGPRVVLIPWSIPDRVVREGKSVDSEDTASDPKFSAVLPLLGSTACEESSVQLACAAVIRANAVASDARGRQASKSKLLIASWKSTRATAESSIAEDASCRELRAQGLLTHFNFSEPSEIRGLWSVADVALFPVACSCGWRGGSLSALHAGIPVLAPAAPPFNETATHMHDAILLRPSFDTSGDTRHSADSSGTAAQCWASAEQLADALRQLLSSAARTEARPRHRSLLRRLSAPQPGLLLARRSAFVLHLHHRLLPDASGHPPTILSFWPGPHADHRRTELFRSDAFRRHGFAVRELTYSADLASELRRVSPELVIAAKPRVAFLKELRAQTDAAVYVWTWDLIDFEDDATRRAWFEDAMRHSTAAFLNELGREHLWALLGGNVHFVNDGTVLIGNRGPSRRPTQHPPADVGGDVVFIGSIHAKDTPRIEALRAVIDAGIRVDIYGPEKPWRALNFSSRGELWAEDASDVEARAKVVLAVSRSPPGIALYRSDRLLRATASGACIVTNAFPGIELMLSTAAVRFVPEDGGREAVVKEVAAALADEEGRWAMRQRAEEITWRRHTWEDSVGKFLFWLRRMHGASGRVSSFFCGGSNDCRGTAHEAVDDKEEGCGSRAVEYFAWVARELLAVDEEQEAMYYLVQALRRCPSDPRVLLAAAVASIRVGDVRLALRFSTTSQRVEGDASTVLQTAWNECNPLREMAWFRQHVGGPVASQAQRACGDITVEQQLGLADWLATDKEAMIGRRCRTIVSLVVVSNRLASG